MFPQPPAAAAMCADAHLACTACISCIPLRMKAASVARSAWLGGPAYSIHESAHRALYRTLTLSCPHSQQRHETKAGAQRNQLGAPEARVSQLPGDDFHHGDIQEGACCKCTQRGTACAAGHLRTQVGLRGWLFVRETMFVWVGGDSTGVQCWGGEAGPGVWYETGYEIRYETPVCGVKPGMKPGTGVPQQPALMEPWHPISL